MKWFRFYHDAIDDPKVQRLEPALFKFWVNMLCLASRSDERGTVTLEVEEIAFALRINDEEARTHLDALIAAGLLESGDAGLEIHNWGERQRQSDDVAQRVAKHRRSGKRRPPADETLPETLPETENPSARDRGERDADPEESETSRARAREAGASAPDTDVSTRRF